MGRFGRRFLEPARTCNGKWPILVMSLLALVLFWLVPFQAKAADPETMTFQVLRGAPPDADIGQICCSETFTFSDAEQTSIASRYGEQVLWLKATVPPQAEVLVVGPALDRVALFSKLPGSNTWNQQVSGEEVRLDQRSISSPLIAFSVSQSSSAEPIYIRIHQTTRLSISGAFWQEDAFTASQARDRLIKTFLFGFLCATIIYNMIVAFLLRDMAFLFNALCISSLLAMSLYLSGYGAAYIWSGAPQWSNTINLLSLGLAGTFGSLFMWSFLREESDPMSAGWPFFIAPVMILAGAVAAFFVAYWVVQAWLLLCAVAVFLTAMTIIGGRAFRGDTRARILLIPLLFAVIPGTGLVALQKLLGISLPSLDGNVLEITFCLEALLFSLAIASRIRLSETAAAEASNKLMALRNESAARVIAAQDSDRQRLAKELHDGVGQDFLVVLGNLKRLGRETESTAWKDAIPGLVRSATAALDELRRISKDMHPASISHLGLNKAIETLFENLETSSQIETDLTLSIDENALSDEAKLHIYRIVQECLSNVSRHSDASLCKASIVGQDGILTLSFEDDGNGLPQDHLEQRRTSGLGFTSIEERVRSLRGHWQLSDGDLGGLKIKVTVPMSSKVDRRAGE